MDKVISWLNSGGFQVLSAWAGVLCTVIKTSCPPNTIAWKIADALIPLIASHGVLSVGKKSPVDA